MSEELVEKAFLAVMNANDRALSLPRTSWAERNLLRRRIAAALRAVLPVATSEEQMEDMARDWLDETFSNGSGEGDPDDALYSADWVMDAFIAGMQRASGGKQ